ncbi:MAG: NhaP-type Na+/H+ or K+/H+ antiporter [Saprospiraceae bacterium]|jgi:NhaP-type Na+/H+ or K+/H+ antiporter
MVELAGIIVLGILAQWFAWRAKVPAILPLIIIGLLVGPISTYWSVDGSKWIEPIYQSDETGNGLFPGQMLFYFVSLSIGVILFEGGLTLQLKEIKGLRNAILKLISIGSLITFIGGGVAAHFIMDLNWSISFLFAGLIIVTGPTVIAPILRNVPLSKNIGTVLKWEGILIDPIGALVAVLVYEFIISGEGGEFTLHALPAFGKILVIGASIGFTSAYLLFYLIKQKLIPHYLLNVFSLALVLAVFVASDLLAHESGLLAVVVMGMVLGNLNVAEIKGILDFKESLSVLLISMLFILLSANMDMTHLILLLDWRCLALFAVVVFVLRPVGVFVSTRDSELSINEKSFISWVGPRGIVAAGIASLFGLRLVEKGFADAEYITPLVFMIVLGTVLLNATTARLVARWLGVILDSSDGVMIVGINRASKFIALYLQNAGRNVVLIDNNEKSVELAQQNGLQAYRHNIYNDQLGDSMEFLDVGYLLAMTSSPEVNTFAVNKFRDDFGENGTYRLVAPEEMKLDISEIPEEGLFSKTDDFINLVEVVRDFPNYHEVSLQSMEHFKSVIDKISDQIKSIPLFIKKGEAGKILILTANAKNIEIASGDILVYAGQEVAFEKVIEIKEDQEGQDKV